MEQTSPVKISQSDQNSDLNPDHSDDEVHVKLTKKHTDVFSDSESGSDKLSSSSIPRKGKRNVLKTIQGVDSNSDDDTVLMSKTKKSTIQNISSDEEDVVEINDSHMRDSNESEHDDGNNTTIIHQHKSRIKAMSSSDEDTQHSSSLDHDNLLKPAFKNTEQQTRMINKRDKMKNKFKNLLSSIGRNRKICQDETSVSKVAPGQESHDNYTDNSDVSEDHEMSNIKQKIKARNETLKSTLYDPDMSDKEEVQKQHSLDSGRKSTTVKQNNSNSSTSDGSGDEELKKIKQKIKARNESLKSNLYDPDTSDEDDNQRRNISKLMKKSTKGKRNDSNSSSSDGSGNIEIKKMKQKIKEGRKSLKSTICDPDTSDDDQDQRPNTSKSNNIRKSTKMISPLPVRMSAKQAMENMQKIKSESNRMLREKEVTLPYHRPKALSLKDIMSRRKPALSLDGKVLPIKMNDEQLRQYALQLEHRQKEMMELCKSDSEDEETHENVSKPNEDVTPDDNCVADEKLVENVGKCTVEDSDKSFDEINLNLASESEPAEIITNNDVENTKNKAEKQDNLELSEESNHEKSIELSSDKSLPAENEDKIKNDTNAPTTDNKETTEQGLEQKVANGKVLTMTVNTELDSELISLHYDSERIKSNSEIEKATAESVEKEVIISEKQDKTVEKEVDSSVENETVNNKKESNSEDNKDVFEDDNDLFDNDDDIDMEDIDRLIENAEIINTTNSQAVNSPMLVREPPNLNSKPKLTGAPGMVIDLDGTDAAQPKKLSGVELLKERFSYFANLKTPEEIEKMKEKKIKPGTQHSKLKHDLEEQMAEQRSVEWAKRLEADKQQKQELNALRGDESEEDEIEKIEAKLAETEADGEADESSSESEEEPEENDKPLKTNTLISGEAEESDCDETNDIGLAATENDEEFVENYDDSDEESSESSEDDDNEIDSAKPKKGRILKAFEDSDDEDETKVTKDETKTESVKKDNVGEENDKNVANVLNLSSQITQDDELQSAQLQKSCSEDIFASQDTDVKLTNSTEKQNENVEKTSNEKLCNEENSTSGNKLAVIIETQPYEDAKFDDIVGMCFGSFSQNIVNTQPQATQPTQTQELGDDVLALCTGKFYDNQFISQEEDPENNVENQLKDNNITIRDEPKPILESAKDESRKADDRKLLKSILEELDGPDFQDPKPNKFFPANSNNENKDAAINQQKKRFVIDSDDEERDSTQVGSKKKLKKRKLQDRALQISDDEEDVFEEENEYEDMSEPEENVERVVEYDSEENEVEVQQPIQVKKKKRKGGEFFENEAELTSEDEYVGSGDEDERGLDRMEREEGDDDTFHQGRLQAELGQIHMRDVLDQDKREVRLIQELLFEDGDLGDGHRQRQFRWRNADGEEETGTGLDEFGDIQEEEYESEEQWRKQRHEREVFLRTLAQKENEESEGTPNVSISRTSIIKANLISRTMSSLLTEASSTEEKTSADKEKSATDKEKSDGAVVLEKKNSKDVPSPVKKPFSVMQQNYRGSILSRGSGALARLAALATPLAGDTNDNAPKMNSLAPGKRSFVFSAVSPKIEDKPKVSKRKGDDHSVTPQLMKKMKTTEKSSLIKTSLLDHLRT